MSETFTIISTVIGVNIALFAAMATLIIWTVNKLDSDVKSVCNRLDGHATRIDQLYHSSNTKHDAQMKRIDQMYQMCLDLLKQRNP